MPPVRGKVRPPVKKYTYRQSTDYERATLLLLELCLRKPTEPEELAEYISAEVIEYVDWVNTVAQLAEDMEHKRRLENVTATEIIR